MTSQRVDALSLEAELFYRRLMSKVDDHGRCEAHAELLRTACYPLRADRVKGKHIEGWLRECNRAGLVVVYEVAGKRYLQLLDFKQQMRSESRFPPPDAHLISTCYANDKHVLANEHLGVVEGEGEVVGGGEIAASDESPAAAASPLNGHAIAYIPLNDGSEYAITPAQLAEFEKLYPAVDVPQTLNEIRGWNLANPSKRKTKVGVLRHVNTWLAREQNRG